LSPVIVEESRLLTLQLGARWDAPRFISGGEVNGIAPDGSVWSVWRGSGSGGCNTDLTVVDPSGHKLEWWSNSECGYPNLHISNSSDKTRLLCYQYYWIGSNHIIHENPSMIRYGIWLVEPGRSGYRLTPVVRNPVSLIAREPEFLLLVLAQTIDSISR
jgi:hypothetical protein